MKKIRYLFFSVIGGIKLNKAEILSVLVALLIIAGYVSCYQIGKHVSEPAQEVEQEIITDQYFVCNFEKVVDAYYQITYSKNGETYYPGFATREQGYLYLEHLEDIGSLDWNGYERN